MTGSGPAGWSSINGRGWADLKAIRARLEAGADPNSGVYAFGSYNGKPLHLAAEWGTPESVTELARRVDDVDAEFDDRTALWVAVFAHRLDNARALVAAGADPWRPMMAGWSSGRLALAGPAPDLFPIPAGHPGLSPAEAATVAEARRLIAALGDAGEETVGVACVANISAAEAARRLEAPPGDGIDIEAALDDQWFDPDGSLGIVGVTDVPGGCVVTQPWGYAPSLPEVTLPLSVGTVCYSLFANPKSGNQGAVSRDGVLEDSDTNFGGDAGGHLTADEILAEYLYQYQAVAYCCAAAGLRLPDARAVVGPPDLWLRLPERDR